VAAAALNPAYLVAAGAQAQAGGVLVAIATQIAPALQVPDVLMEAVGLAVITMPPLAQVLPVLLLLSGD
jgi:hypothetical protein